MSKRPRQQPIPQKTTMQNAIEHALKHPLEQASDQLLAVAELLKHLLPIVPLMGSFGGDLALLRNDLSTQRIASARRSLVAVNVAFEKAAAVVVAYETKQAAKVPAGGNNEVEHRGSLQ